MSRARTYLALLGAAFWGLASLTALTALPARAQEQAALLADRLQVLGNSALLAEGHVEVLYKGARLTAASIRYDAAGRLTIEGPITLSDADGTLVILASQAALDADLQNGILTSARMVLDEQVQLAANEIARIDGRYTTLTRTVTSSCHVCAERPRPLWQIRAERVVHDLEAKQLYFHGAQLRVADVPILYLPRLRLPDPSQTRATGFLIPKIRTTSLQGAGIKLPYFIAIGDSRDVTLTPYFAANSTTLEARYRQAFARGTITFDGAVSAEDQASGLRAYLFGEGMFDLGRDVQLSFDIETTSDATYLLDYDYSDKDRLDSAIGLSRYRADEAFAAQLIHFRTLRANEIPIAAELPYLVAEGFWERRYTPARLGGVAHLGFSGTAYTRQSDADVLGRDAIRLGVTGDWRRDWVSGGGLVSTAMGEITANAYAFADDSAAGTSTGHITPTFAVQTALPMARSEAGGAVQVLEPVAQIAWSDQIGVTLPNEDSALVEFDAGNLLALSRFPGSDRLEEGARATLALKWSRIDPAGWSLGAGVGRVWHRVDSGDFTAASGLDGLGSDWLLWGQYQGTGRLGIDGRLLFDDEFGLTKAEARTAWAGRRLDLGARYVYAIADAAEGRAEKISELSFDGGYAINDNWRASLSMRHDFNADKTASAGLGLEFINECVAVDLTVKRRFTSSSSLEPTTDYGLSVSLLGFGSGRKGPSACAAHGG